MVNNKQKEVFLELRAKGFSFDKIAKELNISKQTLIKLDKELNKEIANLKYLQIENLLKEHSLTLEKKLTSYMTMLDQLYNNLTNFDLKSLSIQENILLIEKIENMKNKQLEKIQFYTGEYINNLNFDLMQEETLNLVD